MTSPVPEVSVVIPTRDRPDQLARCLDALSRQSESSYEVLVLDDGSVRPGTVAAVVAAEPKARLLRAAGRGPAAARNLGAAQARAAVVCFTDDDCEPHPDWIAALLAELRTSTDAAAGPTLNARPDSVCATASQAITDEVTEAALERETGRVRFVPSCNLACRAEVLAAVPFDERFPLAAGEDRDWCARLAERGHVIAFAAAAAVDHRPQLTLCGFWRQQLRYGRGAWRFRRAAPGRPGLAPPRFYTRLLARGFARGPRVGVLICLAQLAVALGLAAEAAGDLLTRRQTSGAASPRFTGRGESG